MDDERLCDVYLNSLAACYDPHAAYLRPSEVALYETGITGPPYTLGLGFGLSRGEFVITSAPPALSGQAAVHELIGWRLLAIRGIDGPTYDLVERDPLDFAELIQFGPLGRQTQVILELVNPVTFERKSLAWVRYQAF
jgi:hypothetical protein